MTLNDRLKESVLNSCRNIAGSREIVAVSLHGPCVCGYAGEKRGLHVLLVLKEYRLGLSFQMNHFDGVNFFILVVSQSTFEKDARGGWIGEFICQRITQPYYPIIGEEYLMGQETIAKKRIVGELLENIVSEYPELSHELCIKAEYFMYETMFRRARLFPPIASNLLNILKGEMKAKNVELMMNGYIRAIEELSGEGKITFSEGIVKITSSFIGTVKGRSRRIPGLLRSVQRVAVHHILNILGTMMNPLVRAGEATAENSVFHLEDPRKYLLIPRACGYVDLSNRTKVEDFVRKTVSSGEGLNMEIRDMGGILNDVYLLEYTENHEEQKFVVKKFRDWLGFKWFAITIWALGTRSFAVLGRSRLEREYAMNQFLHTRGLPVPEILHVSPEERLIVEEFVEGENLVSIIKRILSSEQEALQEAALVRQVGRMIAKAHGLGVCLGDCKPENIIVKKGEINFVDLEQATRNGDQAWDVAEFLYYSGHYVSLSSTYHTHIFTSELLASEFIGGYLEAGGKRETVKKAGSARYIKVFSVFTPPHIIRTFSNVCKRMSQK